VLEGEIRFPKEIGQSSQGLSRHRIGEPSPTLSTVLPSLFLSELVTPPRRLRTRAAEQSRAARGWLDWSQEELAAKANVSLSTVRDFEKARRVPIAKNLAAIQAALEAAGIAFLDTSGIFSYAKKKRR
jgi:DNA-binding XRE family transcriptional regulator